MKQQQYHAASDITGANNDCGWSREREREIAMHIESHVEEETKINVTGLPSATTLNTQQLVYNAAGEKHSRT